MSCQHCVRSVREALDGVAGISRADVKVGHVSLDAEDGVTLEAIAGALMSVGFHVRNA